MVDFDNLEKHCMNLHEEVRTLLHKEPVQVRVNVLLSCLWGATKDVPSHYWAPFLAAFLAMVGNRDGVYFTAAAVDEESDEHHEETLH